MLYKNDWDFVFLVLRFYIRIGDKFLFFFGVLRISKGGNILGKIMQDFGDLFLLDEK